MKSPDTERTAEGAVVAPIPTLPFESMRNAVDVAPSDVVVEMRNAGVAELAAPAMANRAWGVVVFPMPTFSELVTWKMVLDADEVMEKALGIDGVDVPQIARMS